MNSIDLSSEDKNSIILQKLLDKLRELTNCPISMTPINNPAILPSGNTSNITLIYFKNN